MKAFDLWVIRTNFRSLREESRWDVLTLLASYTNIRERCWPGIDTMADQMGASATTVTNARNWLLMRGAMRLVAVNERVKEEKGLPIRQAVYEMTGFFMNDYGEIVPYYLFSSDDEYRAFGMETCAKQAEYYLANPIKRICRGRDKSSDINERHVTHAVGFDGEAVSGDMDVANVTHAVITHAVSKVNTVKVKENYSPDSSESSDDEPAAEEKDSPTVVPVVEPKSKATKTHPVRRKRDGKFPFRTALYKAMFPETRNMDEKQIAAWQESRGSNSDETAKRRNSRKHMEYGINGLEMAWDELKVEFSLADDYEVFTPQDVISAFDARYKNWDGPRKTDADSTSDFVYHYIVEKMKGRPTTKKQSRFDFIFSNTVPSIASCADMTTSELRENADRIVQLDEYKRRSVKYACIYDWDNSGIKTSEILKMDAEDIVAAVFKVKTSDENYDKYLSYAEMFLEQQRPTLA